MLTSSTGTLVVCLAVCARSSRCVRLFASFRGLYADATSHPHVLPPSYHWRFIRACLSGLYSCADPQGFEPHELIGTPSLDLVHPDEFPQTRAIHYSTITQDQAAVLVYLRLRHKDPCKGYILCAIVRMPC